MSEFEKGSWEDPMWTDVLNIGRAWLRSSYTPQVRLLEQRDSEAFDDLIQEFRLHLMDAWLPRPACQVARARTPDLGYFRSLAVKYTKQELPRLLRKTLGHSRGDVSNYFKTSSKLPGETTLEVVQRDGTTKATPCAVASPCKVWDATTGELLRVEPQRGSGYLPVEDDTLLNDKTWDRYHNSGVRSGKDTAWAGRGSGGRRAIVVDPKPTPEDHTVEADLQSRARKVYAGLEVIGYRIPLEGFFAGQSVRDEANLTDESVSYRTIARRRQATMAKVIQEIAPLEGLEDTDE